MDTKENQFPQLLQMIEELIHIEHFLFALQYRRRKLLWFFYHPFLQ